MREITWYPHQIPPAGEPDRSILDGLSIFGWPDVIECGPGLLPLIAERPEFNPTIGSDGGVLELDANSYGNRQDISVAVISRYDSHSDILGDNEAFLSSFGGRPHTWFKLGRTPGQVGYEAYGDHRDWKVFDGKPMPRWAEQDAAFRKAWEVQASAILKWAQGAHPSFVG